MADETPPPPADPIAGAPRPGVWQRARGHLMDLTPLKASREFRILFTGRSISDFGDEIVAVVVPFQLWHPTP